MKYKKYDALMAKNMVNFNFFNIWLFDLIFGFFQIFDLIFGSLENQIFYEH